MIKKMVRLLFVGFSLVGISIAVILLTFTFSRSTLVLDENERFDKNRVILIVLDAFRHDYLEIAKARNLKLTNLQNMMNQGARIMKMVPAFPSVTMPNHQTLVTGLFTPFHGIIYNVFNDSSMNFDKFSMMNQSSLNEARWYKGYPDPIWVSCEKLKNCKTGSMLWPNTDSPINGYRPSKRIDQYIALNEEPNIYPYDRRVDEMLSWIKNDLIDFGLLYFDEPDVTSHKYGPLHEKTLKIIVEMDGWIGRLLEGINAAGLSDKVDIIVTADHGMTDLSRDRVIDIDKFVPPDLYYSTTSYPIGQIYPKKGKEEQVYNLYKNASSHIKVYWRKDVPDKYNFRGNDNRISPIVTIVDLGWSVNSSHYYIRTMKRGNHGYYQNEDDMKASFLAVGPSFKNVAIDSAMHVDVYPLMMHLLGMRPNPNNGSFAKISTILKESAQNLRLREDRWVYDKLMIFIIFLLSSQTFCCAVYLVSVIYTSSGNRRIFNRKRQGKAESFDLKNSESLLSTP